MKFFRTKTEVKLHHNDTGFFSQISLPIISTIGAILIWQGLVSFGLVSSLFLPPPSAVMKALIVEYRYLLTSIAVTLGDIACGYAIGVGLAVCLGFTFGWYRRASNAIAPLLLIISPIPIVTFVPLFVLWFGLGKMPVLLCTAIGGFFPSFMNTISGVKHVDPAYLEVARNFKASDRHILLKVVLPASLPHIVNGLRISTQMTFIITPVAEMIMGDIGLGGFIWKSADLFRTDMVILGQLTLGVLGLSIFSIINRLERRVLMKWRQMEPSSGS